MQLKLRDYQKQLITDTHNKMSQGYMKPLVVLPTGGGKTAVFAWMASKAQEKGSTVWFLVHRKELLDQTVETFNKFDIPTDTVYIGMVGQVARNSSLFPRPDLIVFDECFPAGTLVDGVPIETIKEGDFVTAYNHSTETVEKKEVTHVFKSVAGDSMVKINGSLICTPEHPIYIVERSDYIAAKDIKPGDSMLSLVPEGDEVGRPHQMEEGSVQSRRKGLLLARVRSILPPKNLKRDNGQDKQNVCIRTDEEEKPYVLRQIAREDEADPDRQWLQAGHSRRKRKGADRTAEGIIHRTKVVRCKNRAYCFDELTKAEQIQVADSLQDRHCAARSPSRNRDRRWKSRLSRAASSRQKERQLPQPVRVESVEILQRGSYGEFDELCPDGYVYNLEINSHNNFFANGTLVHNCHHSSAATWRRIVERFPDAWLIGLTATPARLDGKPLGELYDCMVEGPTTQELIDLGFLSQYKVFTVPVELNNLKVVRGDFDPKQAEQQLRSNTVYASLIDTYQEHANGKQAIYFCTTVEHSQETAEKFRQAGIKAAHFDGNTPKKVRTELVNKFRNGEIQILCNVALIGEGFDMPACDVVGLVRPTASLSVYLQQVGRCLRPAPDKTAIIIDHVGNISRHGFPTDPRAWSLEGKIKTGRTINKDGSFFIRQCKECFSAYEYPKPVCPVCGAEYESEPREIKQMEAIKLVEVEQRKHEEEQAYLRSHEALVEAETYSEFCAIAKARGYKTGWAWHQAKMKGAWVPY